MFNITRLIVDLGTVVESPHFLLSQESSGESGVDEISEDQLANIAGSNYQCEFCDKRFLRKGDLEDHKTAVKFREYQEEMFLDTERM